MTRVDDAVEALNQSLPVPSIGVVQALAPSGILRAGINLSNFLLVTGKTGEGDPVGVSPSMAQVLATLLNCDVQYKIYPSPGELADAAERDEWDIGNIGADPARAEYIQFTDAYCEIESTCLVRKTSDIMAFADVDQPGIHIATKARAAYTLWLERNLQHAELFQYESMDDSLAGFLGEKLDVLAGLRPRLSTDAESQSGLRVLTDKFAAVQQAIGTPRNRAADGAEFLQAFVHAAKSSGLVEALIEHHGVEGRLSVADF